MIDNQIEYIAAADRIISECERVIEAVKAYKCEVNAFDTAYNYCGRERGLVRHRLIDCKYMMTKLSKEL